MSVELTGEDLLGPAGQERAAQLEADDPLGTHRHLFEVPEGVTYLAGNSLGLQPVAARAAVDDVLDAWARRAVDGHVEGDHPWVPYHRSMRETAASLVGARPGEAVVMNSLTMNLHVMLRSFYRPTPERHRIVFEADVFPSDRYALMNTVRAHGYDADDAAVDPLAPPG